MKLLSFLLLALLLAQGFKIIRRLTTLTVFALRLLRSMVLKATLENAIGILVLACLLWALESPINWAVQQWVTPTYAEQFEDLDTEHEASIFEQELCRLNPDTYVTDTVKHYTARTARALGVPRSWLYACALNECDLNPFVVRSDKVAASWSQLTNNGLAGLKYGGRDATMNDVIHACNARDISTIMQFSEIYYLDRWILQKRPALSRPVDVYLLLFAPAFAGRPDDAILYQGYRNPAYYKNAGIDGYYLQDGKIMHTEAAKDGKITIAELGLFQQAKTIKLINRYL